MSGIEVFSFHAQDALVPLCGDLHVRDVRYEIIKRTDFDGHNVPSDDQMFRDKDLPSASIHFLNSASLLPLAEICWPPFLFRRPTIPLSIGLREIQPTRFLQPLPQPRKSGSRAPSLSPPPSVFSCDEVPSKSNPGHHPPE